MTDHVNSLLLLVLTLNCCVRAVVDTAEQTSLEGVAVEHHAVILVVALERHDCHRDRVAIRHFATAKDVIHESSHERGFAIAQEIG